MSSIRLCGSEYLRHDITMRSGSVVIFHSDAASNGARGFSFSYKNADCNRTFVNDNGILSNPDYPSLFVDKICVMTINAIAGKTISLYFKTLSISASENCSRNNVKVYDGPNTSARLLDTFCGDEVPTPVFSTGSFLHVVFTVLDENGRFYATYTTTDKGRGCGGRFQAQEGALASPLYPEPYNRTAECIWYISVPNNYIARVTFTAFALNSTDGCDSNYVELYDGHTVDLRKRIARYCGSDSPAQHGSENNKILVKFVSSPSNDMPGFTMTFESTNKCKYFMFSVVFIFSV
ncbi:bone morphogenetic protein 1 homolog [Stegodyphus dumicola]|uniref:bone morphogenetic protein 1 homolog n=1 Tax=Stegodyphus dumicola TaxID=202533 RepID=UPI0015B15664|nr:bone morphogenetic protein 1 homolog [Stegodyphus dumicola]